MTNQIIIDTQILVIGSGAGGATTALTLAEAGCRVLLIEEGQKNTLSDYGKKSIEAMPLLYRNRGMTPILGSVPIGYVEGSCLGGSTEINSGLWLRLSLESAARWQNKYHLKYSDLNNLQEHYEWAEKLLHVSYWQGSLPKSSEILYRGAKSMGWAAEEIPRAANNCQNTNTCSSGCPKGAKQGVSRNLIPLAEKAGLSILSSCKAYLLLHSRNRITGVKAQIKNSDQSLENIIITAENVFVCGGPTQSPALLKRSGIKMNIGNSFYIHPMLKVAALFKEEVDANKSVLPLIQVKEFSPNICLGGSFFSSGHLALVISDNWAKTNEVMNNYRYMANYYVAVVGSGKGAVYNSPFENMSASAHYELSSQDLLNLSLGFSKLCDLLFAAGATKIYPSIEGLDCVNNSRESARWQHQLLPKSNLSLTTVHAFSSVPIGDNEKLCAADSFGKIYGWENLYINDASMLPDSPGTNPQGTIMALARRNAIHFIDRAN